MVRQVPTLFCVIAGDGLGDRDYGHFVIEGKISLIYKLEVIMTDGRDGILSYKSINASKERKKKRKIENRYTDFCLFSSDSCFNIGNKTLRIIFHIVDIIHTTIIPTCT